MNTFQLKFEKKYIILTYVALVLCVGLFVFNLWRCITNGGFTDFYASITYILIAAVCIFAPILLFSVVYNSRYIIENGELITKFGFIKSKYSISGMTSLVYTAEKKKLAIYTGEQFMLFRVEDEWKSEFIDLLRKENKDLVYNETEEEKKGKKDNDDKNENIK